MSSNNSDFDPNSTDFTRNSQEIYDLAPPRFSAYRRQGDSSLLPCLSRYLWNIEVVSTLQPTIHLVEVSFRNRLNNSLARQYGEFWFDDSSLLDGNALDRVDEARRKLSDGAKDHDSGRIVAELGFGFWTSLYGRNYETRIVRKTIIDVFPNLPQRKGMRQEVNQRLREARSIRNRISHHEHVIFDPALPTRQARISDLLRWMTSPVAALHDQSNRFAQVYGNSWIGYQDTVISALDRILQSRR